MLLLEDSGKTNKVTMGADVTRREEKIHHGERRERGEGTGEQMGTQARDWSVRSRLHVRGYF